MANCPDPWLPWVTVRHEYLGPRSYQVSPFTSVGDVKQLLYEQTNLPVKEQRLTHNGRVLDDTAQVGTLVPTGSPEVSVTLEGRGLKGGGRFGQTTPPLVEFLKDILRRYPEGGQILKELIQNAEDAGATEVKFMYDETEYGVESLWSPDMAQHQGTALYVYNDAVFTVEDWNGIQEIARSRKRDDPLKVGRFGIGFNSVYHITDVPSIFSGDQIAMLDPHQTLFGVHESGQCWNLKTDIKEITELADQFSPYVGMFESSEKTIKDGSFPGTIFRFPLRMKPSQLSGNIYNKEKVLELFESFKADADTVLLFLKSVQKISLHVRESDGTERMLFQVTATENTDDKQERPNSLKTLGQAIDSYSNGVPSSTVTCVTYQVNIETQDETTKETQRMTWLVCNGVGGRGMCAELDSLADDLKFMPTIGIALPLTLINREDKGATSGFSGRAFCFLPLPPGEESETGLPVHVSGFFGLTDNRRSIKWREVDQWRDPAALWNELLIITVIPRAYFTLITEAIKRVQTKKDQDFPLSPRGTYGAWPDPKRVKSRWKPILQPLFHDLLQHQVIYSLSESWIRVDQAVFTELDTDEDTSESVINYLQSSGTQVAKVPAAVDPVLAAYVTESTEVRKVTPSLVRQVIRKYKHKGPSQEKLLLLEFVLSDANYSDLIGLELLPLQDETFTTFSSSVTEKDAIYIASEEYPRSLYPGLEDRFILENIKPSVMDRLKTAAKSRGRPCTQLQVLNSERSARLIKEILSTPWPTREFIVQWEPGNRELKHPTVSWLKMIWKHLYIHFADDLSTFDDMPLIPLVPLEESMDKVQLLRLKIPSPIILVDEEEAPLSETLLGIMEKLGAVVIRKLDPCLQHPLLKNYIHSSSPVLVGSSVALVEHTSAGMKKALKLTVEPQVDQVLQHLKAVNDWHKSQAFTTEDWYQFQQILFEIYGFMQAHLEDAREAMKSLPFDWVWTGKTFSSPGHTVLKPLPDLDLQPYLYSLPKTIRKFHKLFKFCGSVEEVVSSHVFEVISTIQQRCQGDITKQESKHDILLLINILRWLYSNQIHVDTDMHVPILCYKDPNKLAMKPIHECTYCDIKVDDLNDLLEDASEPIILVHDDIPMKTAEWLKVPCLSTRLINPENLGFEQSGQREPLTVRIKNILEEYPSVADIFKELLQNADDASATECSFLIDMRKNTDIRENLLDPGMIVCHGPSLWSFNNSVFTDTDFLNITRLGGSVKRCEADKVGKFGLGFNSVYHITDIPIIMSREFMIMFDPNINHISKHIRDTSNPGIKINWSKQQKRLRKFPNQFKPFINVFNCQLPLAQDSPYKYNGTLFRLPFRTEQEASVSEISTLYYNTTDIYSLVDEFSICGHRFILFTQHVGTSYGPLSILKSAAKVMKKVASTNRVPADVPKSGCIIRVVVEEFHNVFKRIVDLHSPLFRGSEEDPNQYFEMAAKGIQTRRLTDEMPQKAVEVTNWLICSCMDVTEALKFSLNDSGKRLGLVPCGGVAVLLSEEENRKWTVKTSTTPIGEVFCYLPLRIKTGLPVHINGCFAVTSNRKEIWKTDTKGQWNSVFMRHVIVQSYLAALTMLHSMAESGELLDYSYYAAWPDPSQVHDDFTLISQGVYQEIAKGGDSEQAKLFSDGKTWVSIKYVRFLDDALLCRPDIGPAAFKIFLKYLKKSGSQNLCAVELPDWVKEGFDDAGCKGKLMENTLTEKQFFSDVFFPHIQEIDKELRDPLMHYVLNEKLEDFASILRVTPCIPCSGPSKELVLPSRLIHPEGRVAKLYNTDDGRFPEGTSKDYLNPVCLVKLVQLGMVKDDLSWEDLIERAESVPDLNENDHTAACVRTSILLSLIDEKLKMRDPGAVELLEKLQDIKFLPFLTRPAGFSLPWHGNNFSPTTMFSARELFTTEHQDTVCLMKPILNENSPSFKGCGAMSLAVKDCLGLIRKPSVELVISQLKKLSQSFDGVTLYQENITNACYKYLHEEMLQDENAKGQITEELKAFNSILVENTYVSPSKVAFHLNFDAAPHLYQLPNKYRNSCRELFENVGVQPSFKVEDFSAVLEFVKQECGRRALTEENFQLCRRIISEGIWSLIRDKKQEYCQANYGGILLPDSNLTLQPSKSLCYNDCPWIKVRDSSVKYCHGDIPREVAVKLGAVPKRHKALERYASNICFTQLGSEFGQKEKLTSRIKSILNAYPSEKEMLKELLQNADDAKATEIYFVFDPRTHPADRIFDDKWIPMQGPALCVFNNQPFTEDDIRGIQNLGRGTKEANPGKTGQYGIGFNSVYHITDCPSFISNNDILCIFDPHAQYAPGATSVSPGRMFRDLDSDFRSQFSDVLNLYLGVHFKLERSTMFRFPIRSTEMAKTSEISPVPASDRMVQNLLDKLKTDGVELLMFLNHMEKISICEIDSATGELKVLYSVTAKITDGDRLKRKQFHASVIDSVTKKKQIPAIPVQQITYTMDIQDTDGNLTTWMICNRSGFPNIENVSKSVISAHKNEDITLFPRGGVAACVSHNYKKPHRAFCFLPLSLETGLPFHVNGHFALDSARRNLWRDDNGVGVRSDWNNNLMTSLIAPACVELLIQLKRRCFPGPDPTMTVLQGTPLHVVKDTLRKFLFFFPVNRLDIQPDWYCLVKAVYNSIHADLKRLLPVVRAPHIDNSDMHSVIYISWVNTSAANKGRALFDNLLQDELQHLKNTEYNITSRKSVAENVYRLKTLLLDIGLNLVHSCDETANLYFCLEDSGIPVSYVTPEDVRNFLHTFSSPDTSCHVGKLPCRLQQSNYKLIHNLKLLVDYCFKDIEVDENKIEGLPLLITMDNMVQVFDSKRPKFLTTHHELISQRKEMFMNTFYIRYSNILLKTGAAKIFDISSFGDLLGSVLPREYRTRIPVKWRDTFASESWLKSVWNFISENIAVKEDQIDIKPSFDTVLDILKDWALLPGIKFMAREKLVVPEHDVLLPLSLMNIAIFPHGQNDKVFHTLMKAGCIQLAVNKICVKENPIMPFLAQHTANIENPSSVLKALEYMIQTSAFKAANLTDKDFEALLLYFNCNLANLTQQDAQSLKLLPCFKSVSGRYISIANYGSTYVLAKSIPSTDIDKWAHTASFAFLADSPQLKELYTFLGCMPIDDLEIYLQHLLPKFENLSYDAKVEHIVYLKERLLSMEESCEVKDQLYEKLEGLTFIYDYSNRLRPTKFFYDETVKVFEVMLPAKSFIPSDFFKKVEQVSKPKNGTLLLTSWITFLRNIGLKHEVSQQQVLQFAKEVSIKSQTESWTKEKVQTIVDVLLNHIFTERTDLFQGTFLKELSMISFLCPERAPKELIKLHSQYQEMSGTLPLIRFSGSQVNPKFKQTDIIHLLWTSCPILPEKATPSCIKDQEESTLPGQEQLDQVLNMLGVNLDPPLEKVISNCKNICNISNPDDEMVKTRNKVLRSTYEFLNADKRDFRYQLRGVAFVMVEDGWKLLKPEEVVINLDNESDFKPYLYKLPLELGTFHQLFKLLGTEDVVSTKQYVEVLWRIYRSSEGKQLDPNEMRTVKRAVSGLFKSLHNDPVEIRKDLESIRDLIFYLPSHDGRLAKSNSLVFDDAPHYKSRIQGNVGVQMLVDMSQCYLGKDHAFHTKLIMLLPQKLRPRLLSSILEEQLDEDSPKMCQFGALCSLQGRLQLLLSSEQFITGLIRIMKHENENAYLVNEEKAIRLCKALCEGLKVSCFEKLQTTLRVKGCSPIPHSCSETLAFLKRYGTAVIHLYIQHSDSKDINFLLALAMTLKSATDNLISDTSYLIAMLGCNDIYRITEKLDNLGVKYDSTEPSKLELPLPGTPIPAEIHHTLLMDPMNVFYPGEYVGYLVDSEGGDVYGSYQPTYTYAIIVQEVEREEEENTIFLGKCFQIDIGYSEYKIVSSLDLYKFSRQDESAHVRDTNAPSTPTSPDSRTPGLRMIPPLFAGKENHRPPPQKQSPKKIKLHALPDILKEVTLVVEQAWKLSDAERKKIIRRLYLKWHPDKNAENLDIATEVFKHLQNEINRMEKQTLADQQNTDRASRRSFSTSSTRFQSEKFSFQRFYSSWNQEATSHKSERQQFREHYTSYAGSSHSHRFFVPPTFKTVGNPVEARRWLRQARANYSAARNDLHKNANEWVCFKCYLATKLALIAADYAVRGKSDKDVKPTALAQKVEEYNSHLTGLANDVQILEGYGVDSLRTRYPDLLPFPQIPNDRYTSEVAMRVMECTARIIIKLESFVQQKI
eukprot:superscaffoldBa00001163_g9287